MHGPISLAPQTGFVILVRVCALSHSIGMTVQVGKQANICIQSETFLPLELIQLVFDLAWFN